MVNIDEFDSVSTHYQGFLKHILQKPVVNLRRPHQQAVRQMKRYASFIGTCNQFDLLTDTTGSRRYLCAEVNGPIVQDSPIDYEQLYAEALHALDSGRRYWFSREEEAQIMMQNSPFQQLPPAEQLSAVEILERIRRRSTFKLPPTTFSFFGRLLQRHKVLRIHTSKGNLYWVAEVA